ncbi:hypothetical protein DICPUDRAFT_150117 [Dictyostelium purpureum]|uniref:Uncharacterized protein n=1 Tax=Dictyostelium purpureum TaxID=5786 RepID=F0ZFH3_DICPU|nr:uncharacterized protein DICPUDRAFT_150117 [Dictyostelium purpureum]EGC37276.1 hypothetical protein DICPUDRAFT_150117 [Dictyostelium purpureum]|eukprot:XP_003286164.1 hypothetical protein DICPUDRAFT_150117 [Dictyostelium purpureum]
MNNSKNILKIVHPIIQAPMLGVTSPMMVAKSCEAGIMGSLPLGGLSPTQSRELIKKTKSLTSKPFSVNLFVNEPNDVIKDQNQYRGMIEYLTNHQELKRNNLVEELMKSLPESVEQLKLYSYHDQIDILLEEGIDIISFTFGILDNETIEKIKNKNPNSILIGTATCLKEALLLNSTKYIDMICLQGIEAGGHRGSFLINNNKSSGFNDHPINIEDLPQIGLSTLVSSVLNKCTLPIIASGGISDRRTIQGFLNMGVQYVQIGSFFIGSNESNAIEYWKDKMIESTDTSTQLTRSFSGRYARGIKNQFMDILESNYNPLIPIPPYPIQNEITKSLRSIAQKSNNGQFTNLWSGQQGFKTKKLPISDLIKELI